MPALAALVRREYEQRQRQELFRDYVGQLLWEIDDVLLHFGKSQSKMPQYIELAHPQAKQKEMSAEEIKQHILSRLTA